MTRFVLAHGAFSGAWGWEPMDGPLQARGHTLERFDLPGAGDDRTPAAEVTLDAYAERLLAVLGERPEPAVLVGHSMGGIVITHAAARAPERIEGMVYVAAFLPRDGDSLKALTLLPEGAGDQIQANMEVSGVPPMASIPDDVSRHVRYNGCSEEVIAWALARQRSQPLAPFRQEASVPEGALEGIPLHYVRCLRDHALRPALQQLMLEWAGVESVVELDTGHNPQLSMTEELADTLDSFVTARVG
jgi:pimeloyl-ACP methyl ester carboxylesterase